jgi:alanine dehydrogenase
MRALPFMKPFMNMNRSLTMRKVIAVLIAGLSVVASATPVFAKTDTVTGEVISLSCYFQNKANVGRAGMVCANATVKYEGNPVGLLTADGKVYQLAGGLVANNNAKMVPFLGHTVTITGDVTETKAHLMVMTAADAKLVK